MLPTFYKQGYKTSFEGVNNEIIVFTPENGNKKVLRVKKDAYLKEWRRKMEKIKEQ